MGKMPAVDGVPLRTPSRLTARPPIGAVGGVQTSGASPSNAANGKLYGEPAVAVGGGCPGLIKSGAGASIVTLKGCEPVPGFCALSVAVTLKANGPMAVGVPESVPSGASASPPGKAPEVTAQVNGGEPPLALNENQ